MRRALIVFALLVAQVLCSDEPSLRDFLKQKHETNSQGASLVGKYLETTPDDLHVKVGVDLGSGKSHRHFQEGYTFPSGSGAKVAQKGIKDVDLAESVVRTGEQLYHDFIERVDGDITTAPFQYDNNSQGTSNQTAVRVGCQIEHVDRVDIVNSMVHVEFFLRYQWHDHRMMWDELMPKDRDSIVLYPFNILGKSWSPQFYIANGIEPTRLGGVMKRSYYEWNRDGNQYMSFTVSATVRVKFDLEAFPFDTQMVYLELRELMTSSKHMTAIADTSLSTRSVWLDREGEYSFGKLAFRTLDNYYWKSTKVSVPRVQVEVEMNRQPLKFIVTSFMPIFLITCAVTASFFVDEEKNGPPINNARVSLVIISILATLAFYSSIASDMPRSPTLTLFDLFAVSSIIFAFAALVLMLSVHYMKVLAGKESEGKNPKYWLRRCGHAIDRFCRWWYLPIYFGVQSIIFATGLWS